jgi:hypothetical protein
VNRSEKFPNVFGGHLVFMKVRPRKDEDSYVYYLGVVKILHLHIGLRSLPLLNSMCKNLPILKAL